jgi:hypothetical protein
MIFWHFFNGFKKASNLAFLKNEYIEFCQNNSFDSFEANADEKAKNGENTEHIFF